MVECGNEGLMAESPFVKGIPEKTKAKDGDSKSVTSAERVAIEEAGEGFIVVLLTGNDAETKSLVLFYITVVCGRRFLWIILTSRTWD